MTELAAFLPDTCTINEAAYNTGTTGAQTVSWSALDAHEDLPCRVGPVMSGVPEYQALAAEDLTRVHRMILLAYHPLIKPGMQAEAKGVTYRVQTVRHDGQGSMTELLCEEVTVG